MGDGQPPAEGPPAGRENPGGALGTKLGPLPLGMWLLVGGGILVAVYLTRHKAATASPSVTLGPGSDSAGSSTTSDSTLTIAGLLAAMQDLAKRGGANSVSPAPVAPSAGEKSSARTYSSVGTSHSDPGSSAGISQVAGGASHLPTLPKPKPIGSRHTWLPGATALSAPMPVIQNNTPPSAPGIDIPLFPADFSKSPFDPAAWMKLKLRTGKGGVSLGT